VSATNKLQRPVARNNTVSGCAKANEKLFLALLVVLIAARQKPTREGLMDRPMRSTMAEIVPGLVAVTDPPKEDRGQR